MQIQVKDLIYRSFRISGVLGNAGRNFLSTGSYYSDAFDILQDMLDNWNTQRLLIYAVQQQDFPMVPGQQKYTIGPGGNWNWPRPPRIERANVVLLQDSPVAPLEIPLQILTIDGWQTIPQKNVQSAFPTELYYDAGFASPGGVGNVYLFPVPQNVNTIRLFLWTLFRRFTSVNDTCSFPYGYMKAIKYNLARELSMVFPLLPGRAPMSPQAEAEAVRAMADIKAVNIPMIDMSCDSALVNRPQGTWNWRTGAFNGQPI